MRITVLMMTVVIAGILFSPVLAAQDYSSEPGYVDFGNLTGNYGQPKVEINLGKAMLNFVSSAAQAEEPEVAELFGKLKSVRVLVYSIDGDAVAALDTVDRVTNDIQKEGWDTIVSVNEEGEKVRIYSKLSDGIMDGLVIMAVNDGSKPGKSKPEAVFINIIGQLDPEQVGRVTRALDINVNANL